MLTRLTWTVFRNVPIIINKKSTIFQYFMEGDPLDPPAWRTSCKMYNLNILKARLRFPAEGKINILIFEGLMHLLQWLNKWSNLLNSTNTKSIQCSHSTFSYLAHPQQVAVFSCLSVRSGCLAARCRQPVLSLQSPWRPEISFVRHPLLSSHWLGHTHTDISRVIFL